MCDRILLFSTNPGRIINEIAVDLKQPRNRLDPRFRELVEKIYVAMTASTPTPIGIVTATAALVVGRPCSIAWSRSHSLTKPHSAGMAEMASPATRKIGPVTGMQSSPPALRRLAHKKRRSRGGTSSGTGHHRPKWAT